MQCTLTLARLPWPPVLTGRPVHFKSTHPDWQIEIQENKLKSNFSQSFSSVMTILLCYSITNMGKITFN